ncbi:MAG: hypothetical protein WBN83_08020 [Desulfoprunum sp.]|jgi:hypothetical protein|uniref:hypothetical protein n=1 Tax=Desulfoprunum sp. TaxID=2020866 RepID=UPI00052B64AF|nr:hypothetical protein JT06_15600 [Desulfobulbus sp. Tol-SR]
MSKNLIHLSYHFIVLLLSAAIAFSIPHVFSALARNLLTFWAFIENEKIFLISLELSIAAMLIIMFNSIRQGWEARKLSRVATSAGLVPQSPLTGLLGRRSAGRLKAARGIAADIMIIGSTGRRTFADSDGELHHAVRNCRRARIMLLNPYGEGAVARARSIPDPEITPELIRDQIIESIGFLKDLKAGQKNIRVKLYPDMPLLKLAILGDHAFLRHYHTGLNVNTMPEYVFSSDGLNGGLYLPFYRYFLSRWNDPDIPEYDLDTDELVLRDQAGRERHREPARWAGLVDERVVKIA